jgi:hypothetical protein
MEYRNSKQEAETAYRNRPFCQNWLTVLLLLLISPPDEIQAADAVEEEYPDLELLEFLGSFSTDAGDFINPADLLDNEFGRMLDLTEDATDNDAINNPENEPAIEQADDI